MSNDFRGKYRTLEDMLALRALDREGKLPIICDDPEYGGLAAHYHDGRIKPLTRAQFARHNRDIEAQITERATGVRP